MRPARTAHAAQQAEAGQVNSYKLATRLAGTFYRVHGRTALQEPARAPHNCPTLTTPTPQAPTRAPPCPHTHETRAIAARAFATAKITTTLTAIRRPTSNRTQPRFRRRSASGEPPIACVVRPLCAPHDFAKIFDGLTVFYGTGLSSCACLERFHLGLARGD